jgi:hypothetical protein
MFYAKITVVFPSLENGAVILTALWNVNQSGLEIQADGEQ